jgi:energy-coupling factor transporter ATP-binding protein EcfA2
MLKRLSIDNYKCFVGFEWKPGVMSLLLGSNGSGKSAVFEVLARLQSVVFDEARISELFPSSSLTGWENRSTQRFEIEWAPPGAVASSYVLEIDHERGEPRIKSEVLSFEGTPTYTHDGTNVTIAGDADDPAVTFAFNPGRSYLGTIDPPAGSAPGWGTSFARFAKMSTARMRVWKSLLGQLRVYRLDIGRMDGKVAESAPRLRADGHNFAAWYAGRLQERPEPIRRSQQDLAQIVDGLRSLRVVSTSRGRHLVATFAAGAEGHPPSTYDLPFEELSEGQKALIALYTILRADTGEVACFDKPDDSVALAEIKPWLLALSTSAEELGKQVLIASHHPEIIDYMASAGATVFERLNGGPTRVKPLVLDRTLGIEASELLARGAHGPSSA